MCGCRASAVCAHRQLCLRLGASQFRAWGAGERAKARNEGALPLRRNEEEGEGLQREQRHDEHLKNPARKITLISNEPSSFLSALWVSTSDSRLADRVPARKRMKRGPWQTTGSRARTRSLPPLAARAM